jgi:hypothetical protein
LYVGVLPPFTGVACKSIEPPAHTEVDGGGSIVTEGVTFAFTVNTGLAPDPPIPSKSGEIEPIAIL